MMRFGIRLLVFFFAVAPFTWVTVTRALEEMDDEGLSLGTGAFAVLMVLMSAGYVYSIIESLYHAILDAKDAAAEAKEERDAVALADATSPVNAESPPPNGNAK